ncbi:quercetin dioxygenase-like cupin family protein [Bradyrhizobium sp. LM6.11]
MSERRDLDAASHLDETTMSDIINFGSLQLRFLQSKDDTGGSVDIFEMTLQPNARMPIPHYHDRWDETIYGLSGVSTWTIDGKQNDLGPGESVFIKRGIVHGLYQPLDRAGDMPVHPEPRGAGHAIFHGNGRAPVGRRATRPREDERDDAALWTGAGAGCVSQARRPAEMAGPALAIHHGRRRGECGGNHRERYCEREREADRGRHGISCHAMGLQGVGRRASRGIPEMTAKIFFAACLVASE